MTVLNLHGYHGTPQNAAYAALTANGCNVISPAIDYDSIPPQELLQMLRQIIRGQQPDMLAGTSFGGFFAAALCAETKLPAFFVNPCLLPFLHLPRLGFTGDITAFFPIFGTFSRIDRSKVSCIVGGADEVIDTHDFTRNLLGNGRFRVIPDGQHSGATLPLQDYVREILHDTIQ